MTIIRNSSIRLANGVLARYFSLPALRAVYGLLMALIVPAGWIILQLIAGRKPFHPDTFDPLLYGYITFVTVIAATSMGFVIGRREQAMTDLALSDGLTGLYNKRYFQTRLEQEFERFQRYQTPVALIQLDLDHFKRVNDTWGHQAGDMVLKAVAQCVQDNLRTGEIAARVGGEEICVIVCNSSSGEAFQLAERLRRSIKEIDLIWQGDHIQVTASFGVSQASSDTLTKWQLYERADKALYQAKKHGRDMSFVFDENTQQAA